MKLLLGIAVLCSELFAARLTIINYSQHPVPAAAVTVDAAALYKELNLPLGSALKAAVPVQAGMQNGTPVVRFFVSLKGEEKLELEVQPASDWQPSSAVASADWNATSHSGTLKNGVVTLRLKDNKWELLFDGPKAESVSPEKDRVVLHSGGYYGWVDSQRRGRVSDTRGFDPSKDDSRDPGPEGAGMISTRLAKIVRSNASVKQNGDVELRIEKSFDSFARNIRWTEVYTLVAGLPLIKYETRFENSGAEPVWVSYVGRGGWVYARYGPGLLNAPRLLSDMKNKEAMLGGEAVRIAWVPEHVWSGIESDSGLGVAMSSLKKLPGKIMQGSMVWQFGSNSFSLPLVEHSQGQYPWIVKQGEPAESGIAFLACAGGTPVPPDGQNLLSALDKNGVPEPSTPYSVYLGERVLQTATVVGGADLQTRRVLGALKLDFTKSYLLKLSVLKAVSVTATPLDGGPPVTLGRITGTQTIDLNAATKWTGSKRFVLNADNDVTSAALERKPFASPEVISPSDNASVTDLAAYFKWKPQPDVRSYELQMDRNSDFRNAKSAEVKGDTHYMPVEMPAAGNWYWRVRAKAPGITGEWTATRSLTVNSRHRKAPILRPVSTERPLFTIEAGDRSDFNKLANAIPEDLKQYFAVVIGDKIDLPKILAPARDRGISVMLRTHHPSPVDGWTPLADVEAVFQQFPNVIGIQGGEALGSWYGTRETARYVQRLVPLAVKYGRIINEGDGCYDENKWKEVYDDPVAGPMVRNNSAYIVFSQKNNIFNKQLMTQSAVLGQYLAGTIGNSGAWEDGGWYWAQVGFRKLGESFGARSGRLHDMPPNFWNLTFLMGLARGATVFSMDGQGGVFMRGKYDPSKPEHKTQVLWSGEGQQTEAFQRFVLPFLRGVIAHKMFPTREQVLENVKIAVSFDGAEEVAKVQDDRYREFWALYAGTYGFRPQGAARGEVIEYFPNTGRYHFIPIIPPGVKSIGRGIRTVAIKDLQDPKAVRALFDRYYPEWHKGDALVSRVGDIIAVMNTHENEDVTETYSVPVNRGILRTISGSVPVHSYLMGKFENGDRSLWLQANANYPERDTKVAFSCEREPRVTVSPASAVKSKIWESGQLKLTLSHAAGSVEINLEIAR